VVQADDLGADLTQVIVAMISGRMFRAGHPSRVVVRRDTAEGRSAGLLSDSVIMTDNLATDERVVSRWVGFPGRAETRHRAPKSAHDDIKEAVFNVHRRHTLEAVFCIAAKHGERLAAEW